MKRCVLLICLMLWWANLASAQSPSRVEITEVPAGQFVEFLEGEFAVFGGVGPLQLEWDQDTNPNIDFENKSERRTAQVRSMLGRYYFDRTMLTGDDLIAIHLIGVRGNFSVFLNGTELFRNYSNVEDKRNSWYRPFLIPIPDNVLAQGLNEINIHSFTQKTAGIGRVFLGSHAALDVSQKSRYFWHIDAPRSANFATLVMGLLILLFWFARKNEVELLWLSASVAFFFIRNHQYYAEDIPFDYKLYSDIVVTANYFSMIFLAAFYFCFVKLRRHNEIIGLMFLVGLPVIARHVFLTNSSLALYVTTAIVSLFVSVIALKDVLRNRNIERGVLGLGIILLPFASLHDLIMLVLYRGDGHATYLAVFCGAIYSAAFIISFGNRALTALHDLGQSQMVLEQSISDTRADLMESEAIRRDLLMTQAMATERERLMQEMHDGIGSNLTTALTVARQQKHPTETVMVLKRALSDLKLTVDSLEPVEGDLAVLIGNLRHRMAPDLAAAGIACNWEVEECRPIPWLDAMNALHVLRIHNEVISNVLAHSNANEIWIGCKEASQNGIDGVSTYVVDNGKGFDMSKQIKGKGLSNMTSRARSLHGSLSYTSQLRKGTVVRLWLPYVRA